MGWFGKNPDAVAKEEAASLAGTAYLGDRKILIFREGFYYPAKFDSEGNELGPNLDLPVVWRDEAFRYALPEDPNHFHAHGLNAVELDPGAE